MIYILIYFGISLLLTLYAIVKNDNIPYKIFIVSLLFSPILLLIGQLEKLLDVKPYKIYFDKKDTPFKQDFQPNKKYHIVWKRMPYTTFLNHKVIKIKRFGIFTIYEKASDK